MFDYDFSNPDEAPAKRGTDGSDNRGDEENVNCLEALPPQESASFASSPKCTNICSSKEAQIETSGAGFPSSVDMTELPERPSEVSNAAKLQELMQSLQRSESAIEFKECHKALTSLPVRVVLPPSDDCVIKTLCYWNASARVFVDAMLSMQSKDCIAGRGWMRGMRQLLTGVSKEDWGFGDFAGRLLRNHHLACSSSHPWALSFQKFWIRVEANIAVATRYLDPACDWSCDTDMYDDKFHHLLHRQGLPNMSFSLGFRALLFVGLPLCMYVSDCPHLYILVRRLQSLRSLAGKGLLTAESVRAALDAGNQPYSILMFAVTAALQALHSCRETVKMQQGADSLEALCASAITGVRAKSGNHNVVSVASDHLNGGIKGQLGSVSGGNALMFRGLWVPDTINEDSVAYTWSLNSFSRSLEGALFVLDYYATDAADAATRRLAQQYKHVFIYVCRFYSPDPELVFPVQYFGTGIASEVEKEVLVPPFVHYVYERGSDSAGEWMGISSSNSEELRRARLTEIECRWGMDFKNECPLLLKLLSGQRDEFLPGIEGKLHITARFVKSIEPAKAIQELFGAPDQPPEKLLLAFPADRENSDDCFFKPHQGAERVDFQ